MRGNDAHPQDEHPEDEHPDPTHPHLGEAELDATLIQLAAHLPRGGWQATLFPGGRSNLTYRLDHPGGQRLVLRRPPLGHVLPTAHDMEREARVLRGLERADFPAPRVIGAMDTTPLGCPVLLMDFIEGSSGGDVAALVESGPPGVATTCGSLMSTLARLHRIDPDASGLGDLGRPQGFLARQLRRWSQQWELTRTRDLGDMEATREWLEAHLPDRGSGDTAVVHGDYRLDNVIVGSASRRIVAVLDWEMATLGDPLADLALALLYWVQPGDNLRRHVPIAVDQAEVPGLWDRSRLIGAYLDGNPISLDHLDTAVVLSCFKLAVITESIHARTLQGLQRGTAADADMGGATEALAALARSVSRHGTLEGLSR